MTLYESDPNYREKLTIFRVFSQLPLFSCLLSGCVCRWFAINIPMDLGTNAGYEGDFDVIACLKRWPNELSPWPSGLAPWPNCTPKNGLFYRTWEVKVAKLDKDGRAYSLKRGKTQRVINQLEVHKRFGSPNASLIDAFLCEAGYFQTATFILPPTALQAVGEKRSELRSKGYGYVVLPFGHDKNEDGDDFALYSPRLNANTYAGQDILLPAVSLPQQPFSRLASRIDSFCESKHAGSPFHHIVVFCKACRALQVVSAKLGEFECPNCNDNLIAQS
jgi:hypothetical protein